MEATDVRNQTVFLWQGQLSNHVLRLQGGDQVSILVRPDDVDFVRVKKTGRSHDASVPRDQMSALVEESAVEDDPFGPGG
ncbi:unnamed protein product [Prunus armeniaca]